MSGKPAARAAATADTRGRHKGAASSSSQPEGGAAAAEAAPAATAAAAPVGRSSSRKANSSWSCPQCTFVNKDGFSCMMCGTPRGTSSRKAKTLLPVVTVEEQQQIYERAVKSSKKRKRELKVAKQPGGVDNTLDTTVTVKGTSVVITSFKKRYMHRNL